MEELIAHLEASLSDNYFSRKEKKTLNHLVAQYQPNRNQINMLKGKIYALARDKVNESNYDYVIGWMEHAQKALENAAALHSDVFFSPGETCRNAIVKELKLASERIDICVFTISDNIISDTIVDTFHRGVAIRILTDNDKSLDRGSDIDRFDREGIPVKMDNTSNHMHHKFMVADGQTLLTGSYNWTRSAAMYNHENILLTKEQRVVKEYRDEFDALWKQF